MDITGIIEFSAKIATVCIAICNLILTVKFFNFKNKKEDVDKENDRRIQWLKSLILDHNLKHFYAFFDALNIELNKLKINGLSDDDKNLINSGICLTAFNCQIIFDSSNNGCGSSWE